MTTNEQLQAWRKANPEKVHAQRARDWARHKDKRRAATQEWRRENRDKILAAQRAYRNAHRDKCRAQFRKNYRAHRTEKIAKVRNWQKRSCRELGDWYVRTKLSRDSLPMNVWPDSLVQLKRAELKTKRLLWQLQRTLRNSGTNS